ncbi:Transcriptional regulator [Clostridiaceae bacterium BL-3]|nr:Transcriptional regulator [Clostridiaceae bacterium BL-3]
MFGEKLKKLRTDKNMTQQELAKILKISSSTIGMYEQNRRSPDIETLKKIAQHFNVSVDYLLDNTDTRESEIEINIPKEYTDKYKVTSRDKKQYLEHMKKANEAFFMNDEFDEEDKKEILDTMSEIFWKAKAMNKRKPKEDK